MYTHTNKHINLKYNTAKEEDKKRRRDGARVRERRGRGWNNRK